MLKTLGEKVPDVNVVEGIISNLSFLSVFDQVKISQDTELMGYRGLGLPQQAGYIANTQFILSKGIKDLGSGRVSENLKRLG